MVLEDDAGRAIASPSCADDVTRDIGVAVAIVDVDQHVPYSAVCCTKPTTSGHAMEADVGKAVVARGEAEPAHEERIVAGRAATVAEKTS